MGRGRSVAIAMAAAFVLSLLPASPATSAVWDGTSVRPGDPRVAAVTTYDIGRTSGATGSPIGCLSISLDNSSAFSNPSIPGSGAFNAGGTSTIGAAWTPGVATGLTMRWTSGGVVLAASDVIAVTNIRNPATAGAYYARVSTYTNSDCVTGLVDQTTTGFLITDTALVQTSVLPTLTFIVTGRSTGCNGQLGTVADNSGSSSAVTMGVISNSTVGAGAQDVSVRTNAASGAAVYVRGAFVSGNLRSATHNFADSGATPPQAGVESFGYTAESAHRGLGSNVFATLTGVNAEVAYSSSGDVPPSCVGYQASASKNTPSGAYSATVTYTAVPSY